MTREELIDILRQRYNEYGFPGIREIVQHIRDHGQIHEPEWHKCQRCGFEWERQLGQHPDTITCLHCQGRAMGQFAHRPRKPVAEARGMDHRTAYQRRQDRGVATPADVGYGDLRQPDLIG